MEPRSRPDRAVLRQRAAAEFLGCSPMTLRRLEHAGEGPPWFRLGIRGKGYAVAALEQWALKRSRKSRNQPQK